MNARAILLTALLAAVSAQSHAAEARLLRFPDIHGNLVVFVYGGDLWRASAAGGPAVRLTAHPGLELFPKISPDGAWIAFSAEYTGTRQVYVMPARGGEPRQLTYYNDVGAMPPRGGWDNWVMGWTADGKVLVRMNRVPWSERMGRYFVVDPAGGLEVPLSLPEGGSASLSPDGKRIAYTPVDREFRTWKRTRGGRAQDVWLYDFEKNASERLTDFAGTDNFPMWKGDTIYFTSDREHTLNLFAYDLKTRQTRQLTSFTDYDVLWPSLGTDAIVFMNGGYLYRFDLATEQAARIPVTLSVDATTPAFKEVAPFITAADLSTTGARVVFEARGELFTVPAKDGPTRNLTSSQGVREMAPAWSPDGQSIAYLSDATGEYEVYVRPQAGGEARRLTTDGGGWRFAPAWSPDGTKLAFGDRQRRLRILDVASGAVTEVDRDERGDLDYYRWSPDSRWLVYEKSYPNRIPGIAVYSLEQQRTAMLGNGMSADSRPVFSADGKHLVFLSNRDYKPTFSDYEFNYLYTNAARVYMATLAGDGPAPFPPKSDEEKGPQPAEDAGKANGKDDGKKKPEPKPQPVRIDVEGFAARTAALPDAPAGRYRDPSVTAEAVFYVRGEEAAPALYRYDLKERKEEKVLDGVKGYALSRDGKKLLYQVKDEWFVADAKASLKAGDGKLDLSGLVVKLDLEAEWAQMFEDGWRITRDWFYDPNMHGVDWAAMKQRYGALVPHMAHRSDLDFLFGEMLGELEAGHTYVNAGDMSKVTRVEGAMLGCTFAADPSGRYRIDKVFPGENWDDAYRSPLTEAGVDVRAGSFLLAIDGQELRTTDNPYRLLEGKAGQAVTLKIAARADGGQARDVVVRPIASEQNLRYLDWVLERMAMVEKLSGGRIGYIHLPNTSFEGNRMLQKLFFAQAGKQALIVDDRYNGGGFIPDRMIEYFTRRTLAWWAQRGIDSFKTPGFANDGPKAMLVNSYSASGGDALPYFFRKNGIGPVIGTRTWGGLIGLQGGPALVDGGAVQIPTFRIYDTEGKWVVENEGVAPDVEVLDLPEARLAGHDPSLEKAVQMLLAQLEARPVRPVQPPVPPVMGR